MPAVPPRHFSIWTVSDDPDWTARNHTPDVCVLCYGTAPEAYAAYKSLTRHFPAAQLSLRGSDDRTPVSPQDFHDCARDHTGESELPARCRFSGWYLPDTLPVTLTLTVADAESATRILRLLRAFTAGQEKIIPSFTATDASGMNLHLPF